MHETIVIRRLTLHDREVVLGDIPLREGPAHSTRRLGGSSKDDRARDISVEPMNQAQKDLSRLVVAVPDVFARLIEAVVVPGMSRLREEARGLIHGQDVVVFEQYGERGHAGR